jgi:hypothetical protein
LGTLATRLQATVCGKRIANYPFKESQKKRQSLRLTEHRDTNTKNKNEKISFFYSSQFDAANTNL